MLLSESEMAQKVNRTRATLLLWRNRGCPYKRFGVEVKYDEKAVMEWLENNPFDTVGRPRHDKGKSSGKLIKV